MALRREDASDDELNSASEDDGGEFSDSDLSEDEHAGKLKALSPF